MIAWEIHRSSVVMLILLLLFAVIHSGGAALRTRGETLIGARAWRLIFAGLSIPSAVLLVGYFLAHRYDGLRLWNVQGLHGMNYLIWIITAISFFFLYPATYNLLEIPALLKPEVRIYSSGIIRISRHPQAIGQIFWCVSHALWIGSSFMVVTSIGLIAHHLFAVWHGDKRLRERFGKDFDLIIKETSVFPFLAVLDGRQKLSLEEFLKPSQLGIIVAIGIFWWAHQFISLGSKTFLESQIGALLS